MNKKTENKTLLGVVVFAVVAVVLVIATFKGVFDFVTAALVFAVTGVIFYFLFVGINYNHSIYGGRFEEHFKNDEDNKKE